jgi:hypothetical protein
MTPLERMGHKLIAERRPTYRTMIRLRDDAIGRGLQELAITCGWSACRLGDEAVAEQTREIINKCR